MGRTETAWGPWEPSSLADVTALFVGLPALWWIAGGHAIELACRRPIREHTDIDVLLLRRDQLAVQELLADWEWWAADPPGTLRRWERGEVLPVGVHDIWCRPASDQPWRLQLMLGEADGEDWVSRRDLTIRRRLVDIGIVSEDGIPYLSPEIQLYYKAQGHRPKDELDFEAVLPHLNHTQRQWLDAALTETFDPGHPWRPRLRC